MKWKKQEKEEQKLNASHKWPLEIKIHSFAYKSKR